MSKNDAVINISLPKELKKKFTALASEMWTNPTNLLKMFIISSLNNKELKFFTSQKIENNFEIEPFTQEEINNLMKNKNISKNLKEINTLLANI